MRADERTESFRMKVNRRRGWRERGNLRGPTVWLTTSRVEMLQGQEGRSVIRYKREGWHTKIVKGTIEGDGRR